MTPREHYTAAGKLTKCGNPAHKFEIGKLIGEWQWGEACWSSLNDIGNLTDYWISIGTTQNPEGYKIFTACIWRFALRLAWIGKD